MLQHRSADLFLLDSRLPSVLIEILLYGIHIVLFFICLFILVAKKKAVQLIILLAITIMFALATVDTALSFRFALHDLPLFHRQEIDAQTVLSRIYPKSPLFITNNLIADALLVYRCYMVWNRKILVLLASVPLLIADSVWGYLAISTPLATAAITFTPAFFWSVFAFNIVMTIATAGRIWWITRTTSLLIGTQQVRRYYTVIGILIESGAIYSITILLVMCFPSGADIDITLLGIMIRVVGIMPTLMIVQVELGQSSQQQSNNNMAMKATALVAPRTVSFISVDHQADREIGDGDKHNIEREPI